MIYVLGSIGAGKTSLTELLAKDMQVPAYYEDVDNGLIKNMLKQFYSAGAESRKQVSAMLQVAFLTVRYQQLKKAITQKNAILDSNLLSDCIMATNLYRRGEMDEASYNVYLTLNQEMVSNVNGSPFKGAPDLVVYISISPGHEIEAIKSRGREMENTNMDKDYYRSVNKVYKDWAQGYYDAPVVEIDRDKYDFVNNHDDQVKILDMIESALCEFGHLSSSELQRIRGGRK